MANHLSTAEPPSVGSVSKCPHVKVVQVIVSWGKMALLMTSSYFLRNMIYPEKDLVIVNKRFTSKVITESKLHDGFSLPQTEIIKLRTATLSEGLDV